VELNGLTTEFTLTTGATFLNNSIDNNSTSQIKQDTNSFTPIACNNSASKASAKVAQGKFSISRNKFSKKLGTITE
jgi:hypothetical protein